MKRISYTDRLLVETKVLEGITEIATITARTLGPAGRPVLIEKEMGKLLATKDGVTVAEHHQSLDPIKDLVASAAREACQRTGRAAGDGTTTAIVLAQAFVEAGQNFLHRNPNYSPQLLARELKQEFQDGIRPALKRFRKEVAGLPLDQAREVVHHVAMVSANHDAEIAKAVTEGVEYTGENGMVVAEEGTGSETTVVYQDGFPVNAGLHDLGGAASAAFVNRTAYSDCVLEPAYVVLYDGEINEFDIIFNLLDRIVNGRDSEGNSLKHPILVVAHSFGAQVMKVMAQNFRSGNVTIVPFISARNGQASGKQAFLHDLAAYVGGKVFDPQANRLESARPEELGFADKVRIAQHETVILTEPDVEAVEKRTHELQEQLDKASDFDADRIRYRMGQLRGGIATVYAGGATAVEAKERHARVVDAISAVRSAMREGVVPGGGAVLAEISKRYEHCEPYDPRSIFAEALKIPFRQILQNAGVLHETPAVEVLDAIRLDMQEYVSPVGFWTRIKRWLRKIFVGEARLVLSAPGVPKFDEFLQQIGYSLRARMLAAQGEDPDFIVYDALRREFTDWYEGGIMDPMLVTVSALENALSVAQLLMTLGGIMVSNPNENEQTALAMQENLIKAVQDQNV
jgi:chaperonin GroEL